MRHAINGWNPERYGFTVNQTSGIGDGTPMDANGRWVLADTQDLGDGLVHFLVYEGEFADGDPVLDTVDLDEALALLESASVKVETTQTAEALIRAVNRILEWQDTVYREVRCIGGNAHCECGKCSICELRAALEDYES